MYKQTANPTLIHTDDITYWGSEMSASKQLNSESTKIFTMTYWLIDSVSICTKQVSKIHEDNFPESCTRVLEQHLFGLKSLLRYASI